MRLQIKNKITRRRLTIVATLIFVEAFIHPINAILQTGAWPEPVQVAGAATTAILQVVTLTLGLLEKA